MPVRGVWIHLIVAAGLGLGGFWMGRTAGRSNHLGERGKISAVAPVHAVAELQYDKPADQAPATGLDPAHRVNQILATASPLLQRRQLYEAALRFTPGDFLSALGGGSGAKGQRKPELYYDLAGFWVEHDLPSAKAWMSSLPQFDRGMVFAAVLPTWAKINLADAFAWIGSLPKAEYESIASVNRTALSGLLAKTDPVAAADFLHSTMLFPLTKDGHQAEGVEGVFREWGKSDPQAASRSIADLPSESRFSAAMGLIASWADRDGNEVETWIATLDDAPLAREARKAYVNGLAKKDPAAAAAYMTENWIPQFAQDGQLSVVISEWRRQDEAAVLAWIKALPDPQLSESSLSGFLYSTNDPQRALDLWRSEFRTRADGGRWEAAFVAARLAVDGTFDLGADFLAELSSTDARKAAVTKFMQRLNEFVPAPENAEAVLRRPEGIARVEFIHPAFVQLAQAGQVAEARVLLQTIVNHAERSAAIGGLVAGELERNPDRAFRLAESLAGTVEGRRIAGAELAQLYRATGSRPELKEWVQKTPLLAQDERDRLLRPSSGGNEEAKP